MTPLKKIGSVVRVTGLIAAWLISESLFAQNAYPTINLSGTIFDEYEHAIGWISKQGIVQNAFNDKIAVIDKAGNAFDGTGQRIGKMQTDGTFVNAHGDVVFTVRQEKDHQCQLVDPQGKIIGIVHPLYKNQAIAIQCVYAHSHAP